MEEINVSDESRMRHTPENRGVYCYQHRATPRYVVRIRHKKTLIYFGSYLSLQEAREARDKAYRSLRVAAEMG